MQKTILIVDDERDLREILAFNLSRSGYTTLQANSAEQAATLLENGGDRAIDLMLLDVMMGTKSGFEFAQEYRAGGGNVPIVFLTALGSQDDLLKGFSLGADDYISKPFAMAEVMARVAAVLARTDSSQANPTLSFGNITLNTTTRTVSIDGVEIKLTKTELQLLQILLKKPEETHPREELLNRVWGTDVLVENRTVDVHIARLRKKIEGANIRISSKSGYGYTIKHRSE